MKDPDEESDRKQQQQQSAKIQKVLKLWTNRSYSFDRDDSDPSSGTPRGFGFFKPKAAKKLDPNSVEDITLTSQKLCEDYIDARLRRSGISDFDLTSSVSMTDYSIMLQNMGQILELRYPKLYSKMSSHLRITYESESVVWDAFNKVAGNVF